MAKKLLINTIAKRLLQSIVVIIIVTIAVFLIMHAVPGDPVQNFLGASATPEQIEHYTQEFGLDQPLLVQYWKWVVGIFNGQLGYSIGFQKDVSQILFARMGTTFSIVFPAFVLAVIVGVSLGIIAALNRGKAGDSIVCFFANIGVAMPTFWIGILFIYLFALKLGILPVQSAIHNQGTGTYIKSIIMPVVILSFGPMSQFARQTRSAMLEVIRQDYVRTAQSKGLGALKVIFSHQLRNAMIPILTVMGVQLGMMFGNTILIESIFNISGLGNLMITAINGKDYFVVQDGVLAIAIVVAICNLVVDILYGIVDPRTREE